MVQKNGRDESGYGKGSVRKEEIATEIREAKRE